MGRRVTFEAKIEQKIKQIEAEIEQKTKQIEEGLSEDADMNYDEARQKLRYLYNIQRQESFENKLANPKVFISFAGVAGNKFLTEVSREVGKLKTTYGGRFHPVNGMTVEGEPSVITGIVEKIRKCCIFVGILTKEFELSVEDDEGGNFAPGAWVLLEAGMAMSLGLRVIFLVEEGVHSSFWKDHSGHWKNPKFKNDASQVGVRFVTQLIDKHYEELRDEPRN